jgi:hypothetical protein
MARFLYAILSNAENAKPWSSNALLKFKLNCYQKLWLHDLYFAT